MWYDEIPCAGCDVKYIGETGRALKTRQKEHMASVRLGKTKTSALAEYAHLNNHNIHSNDSRILATQDCWSKRKWIEALIITNRQDVLFNRDCGRTKPPSYRNIVHKLYN